MNATEETINYTRNYYWRVCTCGHRILRKVVTGGRFPILNPLRCPECGRLIKGY